MGNKIGQSWALGIDFGTSNSLVCPVNGDKILPPLALDKTAADPSILKSVMYTPHRDTWYFGQKAISEYMQHLGEGRLLRSIKKYLPDQFFEKTIIHNRPYNLTELIGIFLTEIRYRAEKELGVDIRKLVLGRPAVFAQDKIADELAEKRLLAAAHLAGFESIAFCPEPVAAAYEFRHQLSQTQKVLIADFGGGTSDYTLLNLGPKVFKAEDILATHGTPAAGDRLDGALMKTIIAPHFGSEVVYKLPMGSVPLRLPKHLIQKMCNPADIGFLSQKDILQLLKDAQKWSIDPSSQKAMDRLFLVIGDHLGYQLFKAVEATKILLSTQNHANFEWRYLDPELDLNLNCSQSVYQLGAKDIIDTIINALDETLKLAQLKPSDVNIVCCTGGTARHPAIITALEERFGSSKLRQHNSFHAVAMGLGEHAYNLLQQGKL